ncbi:hypothetical protein [Geobacillus sp. BK01]
MTAWANGGGKARFPRPLPKSTPAMDARFRARRRGKAGPDGPGAVGSRFA